MDKRTAEKKELERKERIEKQRMKAKQKREREKLLENQTARRKKALKPTKAGGKREGAGRKPIPHKIVLVDGENLNKPKTFTCYGSQDEIKPTRHFLQVWRMLRFNTNEATKKLDTLKGAAIYKLLTGEALTPAEEKKVAKALPDVLALHEAYRDKI